MLCCAVRCDSACASLSALPTGSHASVVIAGAGAAPRGVVRYVVLVPLAIPCLPSLLEILLTSVNFGMGSEEWGFVCARLVRD